jgi:hypothetical protein
MSKPKPPRPKPLPKMPKQVKNGSTFDNPPKGKGGKK